MSLTKHPILPVALIFLFLAVWVGTCFCYPQQGAEKKESVVPKEEAEQENTVGAPQDIKQKTGIWVFAAWMWVSVFVLIYFLRLKIREVDRLYGLRFFSSKKS
jgi:hypothetical protein